MTYVSTNLYIWFQLTLIIIAVVIRLIISLEKILRKNKYKNMLSCIKIVLQLIKNIKKTVI